MGFSLSWIGTRRSVHKEMLGDLVNAVNKERRQMMEAMAKINPRFAEHLKNRPALVRDPSMLDEDVLPNGWHILMLERIEITSKHDDLLKNLSIGDRVIACFVEEHVNYSSAVEWKDGVKIWSVTHPAPERDTVVSGHLPPQYETISKDLTKKQKTLGDCDYLFDVPVELAASITGFRHDRITMPFVK
jgi:hypothetical protein